MTRFVFLDDIRHPKDTLRYTANPIYQHDWVIVRTFDEFVKDVEENGVADLYSFDHDLAVSHYDNNMYKNRGVGIYNDFVEKTGYHCAKWLIEYCIDNEIPVPTNILIHSMNPHGSANIESLFDTYSKIYGAKIDVTRYL